MAWEQLLCRGAFVMSEKKDPRRDKKGPKKDPRQFLDNHPARQGNLNVNRSVDRSIFDVGGGTADLVQDLDKEVALAQQILVYHESQPTEVTNDWMYKLKEETMQYLAEQRGVQLQQIYRESIYKKGIETLIDKIYGLLQRFTWEFNQIASGTDLHVTGTISGDVTEVTRYNKMREAEEVKTYFRARLSTSHASLTVRGRDASVEFYIVPTNRVMALSQSENQYKPIATIQVKITEQGMMWRMKDGVPQADSMDDLCMWLFGRLIEETKYISAKAGEEETG